MQCIQRNLPTESEDAMPGGHTFFELTRAYTEIMFGSENDSAVRSLSVLASQYDSQPIHQPNSTAVEWGQQIESGILFRPADGDFLGEEEKGQLTICVKKSAHIVSKSSPEQMPPCSAPAPSESWMKYFMKFPYVRQYKMKPAPPKAVTGTRHLELAGFLLLIG